MPKLHLKEPPTTGEIKFHGTYQILRHPGDAFGSLTHLITFAAFLGLGRYNERTVDVEIIDSNLNDDSFIRKTIQEHVEPPELATVYSSRFVCGTNGAVVMDKNSSDLVIITDSEHYVSTMKVVGDIVNGFTKSSYSNIYVFLPVQLRKDNAIATKTIQLFNDVKSIMAENPIFAVTEENIEAPGLNKALRTVLDRALDKIKKP